MEISPEDRLDILSLRSNHLSPEHLRRTDSRKNQFARREKYSQRVDSVLAQVESLRAGLIEHGQDSLVEWLDVQFMVDPLSFDLANGIRAGNFILAGEWEIASKIMDGVVGIAEAEKQDKPIRHTYYTETGGVELRPFVEARLPQPASSNTLLNNIGSGRK